MIEEVLLLLFCWYRGSSYSSSLLISTVDSGGLWVLPDVVDVVPVFVVSLVEGASVLEEDVLGGDVLSNLGPSGLPEVPETSLTGLESGNVGVELIGEA